MSRFGGRAIVNRIWHLEGPSGDAEPHAVRTRYPGKQETQP